MNKRDNKLGLLFVLLCVLFVYAFYSYMIRPMIAGNLLLRQEVDADDATIRSMYATMQSYETRQNELRQNLQQALAKTEQFYVREVQEEYLNSIKKFLTECDLKVTKVESVDNIKFEAETEGYKCDNPYSAYMVNPDDQNSAKKAPEEASDGLIPIVEMMEIKVGATGRYSAVNEFFKKINSMEKFVLCDSAAVEMTTQSIAESRTDPEMRMSARLIFVRLYDMECMQAEHKKNDEVPPYLLPDRFMSGAYKNMFSLRNLWSK